MIAIREFVHVNLVVRDVERAREFYGGLLGLAEVERPAGAGRDGVWYRLGAHEIHISYEAEPRNADSTRHIALLVEDVEAARAELERLGYPIEAARPLPGIIRLFTRDPDGNRLELMQRQG